MLKNKYGLMLPISLAASLLCSPADRAASITHESGVPRIAVIDSGIARTPELGPLLEAEYDLATVPARPSFAPRYDHGTMVATILSRAAHREVRLISLRIDDPRGCPPGISPPCQPRSAPIADAIRTATRLGVDVINISLAMPSDPTIAAAIREAAAKRIPIVLAAGNDGRDHPGNLDAARAGYPMAVLVGATDGRGKVWQHSNRPDRQIAGYRYTWQRGVDVPTAAADGRSTRGTGTSFAAPRESARIAGLARSAT
ncbi:MAG: hypothetical protein BGN95_23520 [Sphingomonas sp. 66-10]|nr:MAG: hypothetical protein BGN95_23520 [Sphingomonas sp. 66-10]